MKNLLWGIDLGGTKTEIAVVDANNNYQAEYRSRIPTESNKGYRAVLTGIKNLVEEAKRQTGVRPEQLGIGTPGSLDYVTSLLKNSNSTILNGKPLKHDLEHFLGIPVKMENDANCFALAETRLGVVQEVFPDAQSVFGVIMGTGVGGGLVVNGKVLHGRHGIAGEWGHNFLDASGGRCYCGKQGCVETIISGPALERFYKKQTGIGLPLEKIAKRTDTDQLADKTIERLLTFFGLALSNIINIFDPDVIVLGGGVGNIDQLCSRGANEVSRHVFNTDFQTLIVKPKLGDSAGVFGAALL
jgi:fructokinase